MKRFTTYLSILVFIISHSIGQTLEENEQELFRKYHVKTRTNWDYSYKDGKYATEGKKISISSYDENGRVLENKTFNPKGAVSTIEKFAYDAKGNRTFYERQSLSGEYKKESQYNTDNNLIQEYGYDGSATFKTVFKYDNLDRILEITYMIAEEVDEKRVYTYSENKATVEIYKNGKYLASKVSLLFNKNNQVVKEDITTVDGKVLESKILEYNTAGKVIKEEKLKGGQFFYRINYEYDINGELLSISEESKIEAKYIKKKFRYDESGRIIEYQWKRDSKEEYNSKQFKYGTNGVCSEENTFYPNTSFRLLTKYQYEFY